MRKPSIKSWYTIPDAARRLTQSIDQQITEADVYQLCYERRLRLSWNAKGIGALGGPATGDAESRGWAQLTGIFDLDVRSPCVESWVLSLATGQRPSWPTLEMVGGWVLLSDDDLMIWTALEPHVPPPLNELVIREKPILDLEASLLSAPAGQPAARRASDETRVRQTRAIIAAAIARLGNVDLEKYGIAQRIMENTEMLGCRVNDQVIRDYLAEIREAVEARQRT